MKNFIDLQLLCIAGTDVDSGLEYLPLPKLVEGERNIILDCQPLVPQAKVKVIKDQLKPFAYDIWAWQLCHPEKILEAQPKLFAPDRQEEEWKKELALKIKVVQNYISDTRREGTEPKRLARLESCLKLLQAAQTKKLKDLPPPNNDKPDNNRPNDNNPPSDDNKTLKEKVKNQVEAELKKHNLKTSDLGFELADWENQLANLDKENKIKELQNKIQQEIAKKSKLNLKEEKSNISLAAKIAIISGVILVLLLAGVIYYFLKKKKKQLLIDGW